MKDPTKSYKILHPVQGQRAEGPKTYNFQNQHQQENLEGSLQNRHAVIKLENQEAPNVSNYAITNQLGGYTLNLEQIISSLLHILDLTNKNATCTKLFLTSYMLPNMYSKSQYRSYRR